MIAFDIWYRGWGFGFDAAFWAVDIQIKLFGRTWTLNRGKLKDDNTE